MHTIRRQLLLVLLAVGGHAPVPLPAGWQRSAIATGQEFFFKTSHPGEIFWTLASVPRLPTVRLERFSAVQSGSVPLRRGLNRSKCETALNRLHI